MDKNRFTRIFSLIKKEFLNILKDPKNRALVILPPIMQLFVFGYAITLEVKNIDLSVLDYSNSYYSREYISRFYSSKWFKKIRLERNIEDFKKNINLKKSHLGLIIQNDFDKNIISKRQATVAVILDGRQTNSSGIILGYISQITNDYSEFLNKKFNIKTSKINIITRNKYNENIEYRWFLIVSLIVMLSMVLCILLTSLSISQERELGTMNKLLVSPLSIDEILFGKLVVPLFLAFISTIIITLVSIYIFKIPFRGNFFLYLICVFVSLVSLSGVGLFISSISNTQQMAILGVFTFQTPSVLLSGFVSPVYDMPLFFQKLCLLNPIYYFMLIAKGIYFKDMDFIVVIKNLIPLILIAFFTIYFARLSFKKSI